LLGRELLATTGIGPFDATLAAYSTIGPQLIASVDHRQATAEQSRFWIVRRLNQVSCRKKKGKRKSLPELAGKNKELL
jgi:hypothetical protein